MSLLKPRKQEKKKINIDEIPDAVKKVWVIEHYCKTYNTGVGSELVKECEETIKKYPEYFKK